MCLSKAGLVVDHPKVLVHHKVSFAQSAASLEYVRHAVHVGQTMSAIDIRSQAIC